MEAPAEYVPNCQICLYDICEYVLILSPASYYCTYAKMWTKVKSVYKLTITSAEKSALTSMLNTC